MTTRPSLPTLQEEAWGDTSSGSNNEKRNYRPTLLRQASDGDIKFSPALPTSLFFANTPETSATEFSNGSSSTESNKKKKKKPTTTARAPAEPKERTTRKERTERTTPVKTEEPKKQPSMLRKKIVSFAPILARKLLVPDQGTKAKPSQPHPLLEYPLFYFMLKLLCPCCLHSRALKLLYRCRWALAYPLQRQVPLSNVLRKMKVYCTWGELFLVLPFFATLALGFVYTFWYPSVAISGQLCRTPLIVAFATATHNSFLTLLLGIPFERALWYHKLTARIAYFNSLLHTWVAFAASRGKPVVFAFDSARAHTQFGNYLVRDQINTSGTLMVIFITLIILTALPWVRRRVFEVFQYCHFVLATAVVCSAFFHTGFLVPLLAGVTWGLDWAIRRFVMAGCRYPKRAQIRILSETVVELVFPKESNFDYNPGQYLFLCVPKISVLDWHPFTISSSPIQKVVTLHIRKAGAWTTALYNLAKDNDGSIDISIFLEGPYGSVGVDLMSMNRYKMVMLISGGIGVTPMQSLCNQLMYEHNAGQRQLKKLSFVWIERDPATLNKVDVVRQRQSVTLADLEEGEQQQQQRDEESVGGDGTASVVSIASHMSVLSRKISKRNVGDIASTILSMVPQNTVTDIELESQYPDDDDDDDDDNNANDDHGFSIASRSSKRFAYSPGTATRKKINRKRGRKTRDRKRVINNGRYADDDDDQDDEDLVDDEETVLKEAYGSSSLPFGDSKEEDTGGPLDLQVYLTAKNYEGEDIEAFPFIRKGRPDLKGIFRQMRRDALLLGERRVAVCICAPKRLVNICQAASVKFSDSAVQFDFHQEIFD